jgi:hypothetical protein
VKSGNIFPDVLCQYLIDEGLVTDPASTGFLPELLEHARIDTNRNELTRLVTQWRSANPAHCRQLLGRGVRNIREVNLSAGTPRARDGSPAAR